MKRFLSSISLFLCFLASQAQDLVVGSYDVVGSNDVAGYSTEMRDLWIHINDSLTPYLTQRMRKEMVELKELGVSGDVKNQLDGTSVLDSITNDYLKVQLSKAKSIEMKRLAVDNCDYIICMVTTYYVPEPQSSIEFYTTQWKKLDTKDYIEAPFSIRDLMHKPDSISDERYEELSKLIEFDMVDVRLSVDANEMTISPSFPLLSKNDKSILNAIFSEKKLIWNGKTFKRCYNTEKS